MGPWAARKQLAELERARTVRCVRAPTGAPIFIEQGIVELADLVPIDTIDQIPEKKSPQSAAEELLAFQLLAYSSIECVRQLRFAKTIKRNWRFDFAFEKYMLAVEIDGVVVRRIGGVMVTTGRHANVQGMRKDHMKGNAAIMYGWSVLHFLQDDVKPRRAINTILRVLSQRGWRA